MTSLDARLLLDREVLDDPNSFYHRLVVEAPVWRVGEADVYAVSSYAAVSPLCPLSYPVLPTRPLLQWQSSFAKSSGDIGPAPKGWRGALPMMTARPRSV